MINCKDCQRALTFDEWHISKKGNKIPLDAETFEPHRCQESLNAWRLMHPLICKQCGETQIYFDDKVTSASGKLIPLEAANGNAHNCPKSQYHYRSR